MCSNRAIVDSLECYMDDLVECFEDFVKKSLLVISFGIGLIVAMLAYLLKTVCERPPIQNIVAENAVSAQNQIRNMERKNEQILGNNNNYSNYTNKNSNKLPQKNGQKETLPLPSGSRVVQTTIGVNTIPRIQTMPSYDEQVLRDIGFSSCSRSGCRRRIGNTEFPSRFVT
ncbi:unnamed protein product [Euphydryas editha]|uniref:Uncharacterized protein n=1 Tax=Euphydryas editha TaxID=104508 RepID=A0AAU9V350_EUPED|nr:unnamed protein product [Euphydryas editha]